MKYLNQLIEQSASFCRDETMLQSALDAPENHQHYMNVNDPAELAAILSSRIIKNHPFANGNKRTALLAANLFLVQTGKVLQQDALVLQPNDVITQAHNNIAMGTMEEGELAEIYRKSFQDAMAAVQAQAASLVEDADKEKPS